MNKLKIYSDNRKYYSKEFIQGWERGVQNQFDVDVDYLENLFLQIRAEIEKVFCMSVVTNELRTPMEVKTEILQIINKYRAENEE